MKEIPMLFSGPRVRDILEDRKTQTRRPVKPQPHGINLDGAILWKNDRYSDIEMEDESPAQPGDRIWIRETFTLLRCTKHFQGATHLKRGPIVGQDIWLAWYDGTPDARTGWVLEQKRIPSIHMPRWASRITLEIVNLRVERLQEISDGDVAREGIDWHGLILTSKTRSFATDAFSAAWDLIYSERGFGWEKNPFVWVISFRRINAS